MEDFMKQNRNKTVKRRKAPKYRTFTLQLPYSHGLLYRAGLIPENTDGVKVMRVMVRLIRVPVIAKRRALGMTVKEILERMSERSLQLLRKRL
jgi:hypothetical protein